MKRKVIMSSGSDSGDCRGSSSSGGKDEKEGRAGGARRG